MTTTGIAFPPYHPEPKPLQDTDGGLWDTAFDADVRRLEQADDPVTNIGALSLAEAQLCRLALSDNSQHRNHAWLAWWRMLQAAERAGLGHLAEQYAPHERPGFPAHERHIKACTTRLRRALCKYPGFIVNRPAGVIP